MIELVEESRTDYRVIQKQRDQRVQSRASDLKFDLAWNTLLQGMQKYADHKQTFGWNLSPSFSFDSQFATMYWQLVSVIKDYSVHRSGRAKGVGEDTPQNSKTVSDCIEKNIFY